VRDFVEEHGVEAASMRRVAQEVGVSTRTLYNHFGDKRAMLRALVLASFDEIDVAFDDLQAPSPIERMREATSVAVGTAVALLPPAVLSPVLDDHEMLVGLSSRWPLRELLGAEIRAAQKSGQLYDDVEPAVIVEQVNMVLDYLLRGWAAGLFDEGALRAGVLHTLDVGLLAAARPRARAAIIAHAQGLAGRLPGSIWPQQPSVAQKPTLRRGRQRRFDDTTERALLMDAALRVMAGTGYADLTVTDILAESGLSTRSYYRHFASKEVLFRALLDREIERLAQALHDAVASAPGPVAAVEAWIEAYLDTFYDPGRTVRSALHAPDVASVHPVAGELGEIHWTLSRSLADALRAGHEAGLLVSPNPDRDALSIFSLIGTVAQAPHQPLAKREEAQAQVMRFVRPALRLGQASP
jgi:AcrR family transcriptional regulator